MSETIIGVIVGGVIGIASTLIVEVFRNKHYSRSLANAFKGEISALIKIMRFRKYLEHLNGLANEISDNQNNTGILQISASHEFLSVYNANCSNLGKIKFDISAHISEFYINVLAVLEDFKSLQANNQVDKDFCKELHDLLFNTIAIGENIVQSIDNEYS